LTTGAGGGDALPFAAFVARDLAAALALTSAVFTPTFGAASPKSPRMSGDSRNMAMMSCRNAVAAGLVCARLSRSVLTAAVRAESATTTALPVVMRPWKTWTRSAGVIVWLPRGNEAGSLDAFFWMPSIMLWSAARLSVRLFLLGMGTLLGGGSRGHAG
jgi:hypothetical protein